MKVKIQAFCIPDKHDWGSSSSSVLFLVPFKELKIQFQIEDQNTHAGSNNPYSFKKCLDTESCEHERVNRS
jgi:hypothetical protein